MAKKNPHLNLKSQTHERQANRKGIENIFLTQSEESLLKVVKESYQIGQAEQLVANTALMEALEAKHLNQLAVLMLTPGRPRRPIGYFNNFTSQLYVFELERVHLQGRTLTEVADQDPALKKEISQYPKILEGFYAEGILVHGEIYHGGRGRRSPHLYGKEGNMHHTPMQKRYAPGPGYSVYDKEMPRGSLEY